MNIKIKLIAILSLILIFSQIAFTYSAYLTKDFYTGGYWLGCYDVYIEIDFYLYSLHTENFEFFIYNLDNEEWHSWKIENDTLYMWIFGSVNGYKFVCNLKTEIWLRLKLSYQWSKYLDFVLEEAESGVIVYSHKDFFLLSDWETWDVYVDAGFPHFGINPEGNMRFKFKLNSGAFAISKIHIHSAMKYFTNVQVVHLNDEFNDDSFTEWDAFDLSGFNYTIVQFPKDSFLKIWQGAVAPSDPTEKTEQEWWVKLGNRIWQNLVNTWNYITSTIANLLPKTILDFFNWLWRALNWLWSIALLGFTIVLGFAPYFGVIIIFSFIGSTITCIVKGDLQPLISNVYFWYNLIRGIINAIASVVNTIYNFIKVW